MASADRQDSIATGMGWRNHVIACSPFLLFAVVLGIAMLWYWLLFNSSAIIAPFRMDIGDARGSISSPAEASYRMQFYVGAVGQCLSAIVAILVAFLCFRRHCRYLPGTTRIL